MYYKSLFELIKELCKNNSAEITEEVMLNDAVHVYVTVFPNEDKVKCPECGSNDFIKFGKKSSIIKDDVYSHRPTFLHFTHWRLKCKCGKLFVDKIPTVTANTSISQALKLNIIQDLKEDVSFKYIAQQYDVSTQTVIDVFERYVSYDRYSFEDVLCIDEFKNLKHSKDQYAFVLYDPNRAIIVDILRNRLQSTIDDYLFKIDFKEKDKVKYVISDMFDSYRTIGKRHFPKATHVIDCYHYLRYVEDALNAVRIRIQKKFGDLTPQYKMLKRNWRILSSYCIDLNYDNSFTYYNHILKKNTPLQQIINDTLNVDPEMENAYDLTQEFLRAVREVKFEEAKTWINEWIAKLNASNMPEFQSLSPMFENWKNEIVNSFIRFGDRRLHNGYLEGINTHIKLIKRVSYGYTNFTHFRNRIMHIINKEDKIKEVDTSKIYRRTRKRKHTIK